MGPAWNLSTNPLRANYRNTWLYQSYPGAETREADRYGTTSEMRGRKDKHELWSLWRRLVGKCTDPRHPQWAVWGGLGFTVCERWTGPDGFWNFVDDMPERPPGKNPHGRSSWKLELIYGTEWNGQSCHWVPARRRR